MEDIEYLEEYEDLVLPALNSAAAAAAASLKTNKNQQNQKAIDNGDDSSSSLDQDIFNCLFDDNSDDDEEDLIEYQRNDNESTLRRKSSSNELFESLHDDDIGEKIIQKVEISRQETTNQFNTIAKPANKITSSTPKPKTFMTKTSGTTIQTNTARPQTSFVTKPKSIATVRPTVQNQQKLPNTQKKAHLVQRPAAGPSSSLGSSSFSQRQNPTTSLASTSSRAVQLPVVARKPLSSTGTSSSTSVLFSKQQQQRAASSLLAHKSTTVSKKLTKRPATIVRPEKIVTKDPANDPLDLDDLSEAGSDNYSFSDISGETYNSISEFDDDDDDSNDVYYSGDDDYYEEEDDEDVLSSKSHVIELSNDSSGAVSNLEDFRASTPTPVISDDSDTHSTSSGLKLSKTKSIKPYTHPEIIESVLRKGEKPKLLELLQKHNLLEDSVENVAEDIIDITDITVSRENLVDNFGTLQVATSVNNTAPAPAPTNTILAANIKPDTSNPAIKTNPTKHSNKTNKRKTNKKSVTNMEHTNDYRELKSPGGASTDSDLSAVEELLEESYAQAMKLKGNISITNQDVGAEIEVGGEEEIIEIDQKQEENKQKLPKSGVVIDYDDNAIDEQTKVNEVEEKKEKVEGVHIEKGQKENFQKNEELKETEKVLEVEKKEQKEFKDKIQLIESSSEQKDSVPENPAVSKSEVITEKALDVKNIEEQNTAKSIESNTCNSPSTRKKKRFRNLKTPEVYEGAAKSIDEVAGFKGFEEVAKTDEIVKEVETKKLETPVIALETGNISEKDGGTSGSFKSPTNSHKSLKDKGKESSQKSSGDNSKDSKNTSSKHSTSKSSRDNSKDKSSRESSRDKISKDKSSRESSRDKSSRESSRERSRESSKDRSKHTYDKDSKHHHKDHRKSRDSKDSSKSRESSKSRDLKETKQGVKEDTKDAHKSSSAKKDQTLEREKEKPVENKDIKTRKETDKNSKDKFKSGTEMQKVKEQDNKMVSKDEKTSLEKKDKKPAENVEKMPKEKDLGKSQTTTAKDTKSFSSSSKTTPSCSRDSSKERKSFSQSQILSKSSGSSSSSKTEKSDFHKPKVVTDLTKSVTTKSEPNKPKLTTTTDSVKVTKTCENPKEVSKSLQSNKEGDKLKELDKSIKPNIQSVKDSNASQKVATVKQLAQNPVTKNPPKDLNTSTPSSSKNTEGTKNLPPKIVKDSSSDTRKTTKSADQNKKDADESNKSIKEKRETSNEPAKTVESKNTGKQSLAVTVKRPETVAGKQESSSKPKNSDTNNTTVNENKIHAGINKTEELKPKEKTTDLKKPTQTTKSAIVSVQPKVAANKNKDSSKTISMSLKTAPKHKEENIKIIKEESDTVKIIEEATAKTKELNVVKTSDNVKPGNTKTTATKIPEKPAVEGETPKTEVIKTKYSKDTVGLKPDTLKSQPAKEKNVIVTSNTSKETKETSTLVPETNEVKPTNSQESPVANTSDKQTVLVAKITKDKSKEEVNQNVKKNDKQKELSDPSKSTKTDNIKILEISKNEQTKSLKEQCEPKTTTNPNDSNTTKTIPQVGKKENKTTDKVKADEKTADTTSKSISSPKPIQKPEKLANKTLQDKTDTTKLADTCKKAQVQLIAKQSTADTTTKSISSPQPIKKPEKLANKTLQDKTDTTKLADTCKKAQVQLIAKQSTADTTTKLISSPQSIKKPEKLANKTLQDKTDTTKLADTCKKAQVQLIAKQNIAGTTTKSISSPMPTNKMEKLDNKTTPDKTDITKHADTSKGAQVKLIAKQSTADTTTKSISSPQPIKKPEKLANKTLQDKTDTTKLADTCKKAQVQLIAKQSTADTTTKSISSPQPIKKPEKLANKILQDKTDTTKLADTCKKAQVQLIAKQSTADTTTKSISSPMPTNKMEKLDNKTTPDKTDITKLADTSKGAQVKLIAKQSTAGTTTKSISSPMPTNKMEKLDNKTTPDKTDITKLADTSKGAQVKLIAKKNIAGTTTKSISSPKPTMTTEKVANKTLQDKKDPAKLADTCEEAKLRKDVDDQGKKIQLEKATEKTQTSELQDTLRDPKLKDAVNKDENLKDTPQRTRKSADVAKLPDTGKKEEVKEAVTAEELKAEPMSTRKSKVNPGVSKVQDDQPSDGTKELKETSQTDDTNLVTSDEQLAEENVEDEDECAIEPRITRSRIENMKSNESMTKEESTDRKSKNTESTNIKKSGDKFIKDRIDKPDIAEQKLEIIKPKKKTVLKEDKKTENKTLEMDSNEKTQINDLKSQTKELKTSGDHKTTAESSIVSESENKKQKEQFEARETKIQGDLKGGTDVEIIDITSGEQTSSQMEQERVEPIKTRSRGVAKVEEGKEETNEISQIESGEKSSAAEDLKNQAEKDLDQITKTKERAEPKAQDTNKINQTKKTLEKLNKIKERNELKSQATNEITQSKTSKDSNIQVEEELVESSKTIKHTDFAAEIKEITQAELTEEDDAKHQTEEENFEPSKKRKRLDHKAELGTETKELTQAVTQKQTSSSQDKEEPTEPIKTRKLIDIKAENVMQATEMAPTINQEDDSKSQLEQEHFEPRKTRSHAEAREISQAENVMQTTEMAPTINQEDDSKSQPEQEHFEPRKTRSHAEAREISQAENVMQTTEMAPTINQEDDSKSQPEQEHFEPRKTRSHAEAREISQAENVMQTTEMAPGINQEDDSKSQPEQEHFEPRKTRSHAEAREISQDETQKDKISSQDEQQHLKQTKTRKRGDLTAEVGKETTIKTQTESLENKTSTQKDSKHSTEEETFETRKTRRHVDVKEKSDKETIELFQDESFEEDKTLDQKDSKHQTKKEKVEPRKTRRHVDNKEKFDKDTIELIKNESFEEDKTLDQKDFKHQTQEEHFEPRKTRRHADNKEKSGKEISELPQVISSVHEDTKNQTESQHLEPIKTRRRADLKAEIGKETTEITQTESQEEKSSLQHDAKNKTEEHFEARKTRKRADINAEIGKEIKTLTQAKLSEEITTEQDDIKDQTKDQFEPIKTRKRAVVKGETEKETTEMPQVKSCSSQDDSKTRTEPLNNTKSTEVKIDDLQQQVTPLAGKTNTKTALIDNITPTADEIITKDNSEDGKKSLNKEIVTEHIEPSMLETVLKSSQDSLTLEADMSGSESSITSSNSDNTRKRRTLRKRATETPLPENDNKKKLFKEPPLKSPALITTPKSTKHEKPTTIGSITVKRISRSPALSAENQNSTKKPKLDTSRKSARFRNIHDDCLVEEEIPIVTANVSVSNVQDYLHDQQAVQEPSLNKNTEKAEEPLKNIDFPEKKSEETTKDFKQTPAKVLPKDILEMQVTKASADKGASQVPKQPAYKEAIQVPKQSTNKEALQVPKQFANKDPLLTKARVIVNKCLRLEEIKPKPNKTEFSSAQETSDQAKTNKAKVNISPNKSPGCNVVLSFSDWLKTKRQHVTNATAVNETTTPVKVAQSKVKAKPTPKVLEPKPSDNKEVAATPPQETNMMCQNKEKTPDMTVENKQGNKTTDANVTTESMNISSSDLLDNSLLQPSANQLQNAWQQQQKKGRLHKSKVKRLQTSSKKLGGPVNKPKTPTTITPPKSKIKKKREIDVLMESMSKEMKDGGISDLLNTDTHVKRQRLVAKKILNDSKEQLNTSNATVATTKETANVSGIVAHTFSGLMSNKVIDFSENSEILTNITTTTPKEVTKSPTKRKLQQSSARSKKPSTLQRDMFSTPDILATAEHTYLPENPKVLATKSRKSLNTKELLVKATENVATAGVVKSRKSMPLTSKETLAQVTNVVVASSRKSLVIPKQQQPAASKPITSSVFKTPKQPSHSNILGQIPNVNIKKLFESDGSSKRSDDSRIKLHLTPNRLKTFKYRKLSVRLNRSTVKKYLSTINNRKRQTWPTTQPHAENIVPELLSSPAEILPTIQNNSEINLLLQSVVDAVNTTPTTTACIATPVASAQPFIIPNTDTLLTYTSIPTPATTQLSYVLPTTSEPSSVAPFTTTTLLNVLDTNETIELKNEFVDENPIGSIHEAILPDTPTLLARAQSITEAAQHALSSSITPTDIRLLGSDSATNSYVPSFGVTPRALDNRGTCMYTFLHPAKYNRNHSNVLLDYCCPNLNGPMPAIDPTRIHAQVQMPVIELPASIVLTTKVILRADLESGSASIPAIIRKKAEKIRKNLATHTKIAVATTAASAQPPSVVPVMAQPQLASAFRQTLPPTINALTKQLPATTTITAKIRASPQSDLHILAPPAPAQTPTSSSTPPTTSAIPRNTIISVMPKEGHMVPLNNMQKSSLRSNLRRFDVLLKQLVQPFDSLSFVDRHRIIEALMATGKFSPKDLEQTLVIMEEYIKQTLLLKNDKLNQSSPPSTSAILSSNNYITTQPAIPSSLPSVQMPQLQPSPSILASGAASSVYSRQLEQMHNKVVRNVQSRKNTGLIPSPAGVSTVVKQRQVPIYDTDRNIIGYQMQPLSTIPAYTKSTMSTHTGAIMSTSLDSNSNKNTSYSVSKRPMKRPAQESPRVFYTTPPLKTSTPKAITNPHLYPTAQHLKNPNTIAKKTQGSIIKTVRSGGSSTGGSSETITTTTMATVKRVTRSTATGSKIVIVSKSNQSSEETILPDGNNQQQQEQQAEIKNEEEDFLG